MNTYTPDRWVMVEVTSPQLGKIRKVLGSWRGGYLDGDSWKLSSGNLSVIDKGDHYEIPQESGSVYYCYKNSVGMTSYTAGVFQHWKDSLAEHSPGSTLEIVEV